MLAQLHFVEPKHLLDFSILMVVLAGLVLGARAAFRRGEARREIEPQPLEVKPVEPFVTAGACRLAQEDTSRRLTTVEQEILALRREMREDRERLSRQMLEELGKVYDRLQEGERRLEDNMRTLPSEIVALLRNTGAIRLGE
jgi:hypothetical protein